MSADLRNSSPGFGNIVQERNTYYSPLKKWKTGTPKENGDT